MGYLWEVTYECEFNEFCTLGLGLEFGNISKILYENLSIMVSTVIFFTFP